MKKLLLLPAILFSVFVSAQVPQGVSYQAIALNGSGTPVVSSNVGVRLSVLDNAATGSVLFTETHVKTTNAQGLFNLVIGQGTPTAGTFATINWALNSKFLKVEMDVAGGSNYTLVGTTQLLSVPYALYSGNSATISDSALNGFGTGSLKDASFVVLDGQSVRGYSNGIWSTQAFTNFINTTAVINSDGNFIILDGQSVKGFSQGTWSEQSFTNFINSSAVIASNGIFAIIDGQSVKCFFNGNWSSQVFSNFINTSAIIESNGSFIILDGQSVKGFHKGNWTTQSFASFINTGAVINANGNFIILDGQSVKAYSDGAWTTQTFTSFINSGAIISSEKN